MLSIESGTLTEPLCTVLRSGSLRDTASCAYMATYPSLLGNLRPEDRKQFDSILRNSALIFVMFLMLRTLEA
jgi:hypothetical protein